MTYMCDNKLLQRSFEVTITENASSIFGSYAAQKDDHDLSSLWYYDDRWVSADNSLTGTEHGPKTK